MFSDIEVKAEERVGIVTHDGDVVELINVSNDRVKGFSVSGEDLMTWFASGQAKSSWHTHDGKSANLSADDYQGFLNWPEMDHYIISHSAIHRYYTVNGAVLEDISSRQVR